jgi:hypothetical protein
MSLKHLLFPLLLAAPVAGFAQAQVSLSEETHINQSLMAAVVGDNIRKTCPTISARMIVAYSKAKELERYAIAKGYKKEAVEAFLKDKTEKARVKKMAAEYMTANGVVEGDVESYCKLGRAEIEKRSLIGSLLRAY